MKLSKEQAREFIWSKTSPDVLGVEREAITDDGSGRWQSHHTLVLKDTAGRYWAASYSRGLTEMQDGSPFEDDPDEIEFHQVAKVPVLTYEYKGMGLEGGDSEPAGDSPDSPATPESRVPGQGDQAGADDASADYAGWPAGVNPADYDLMATESYVLSLGPPVKCELKRSEVPS